MKEENKVILALTAVALLSISFIAYDITLIERMAKLGFMPYRLPGNTTVYWTKPPETSNFIVEHEKKIILKEF